MPTVTSLGSASATTSGTTITMTVTANVAIGETIFVGSCIALNTGTETLAITDSGGNSYTNDVSHVHSAQVPLGALHRAVCTVALTSGVSTITSTNTVGNVNERIIGAFKLAAGDVISPITLDGTNNNEGGATTSATPGSVTPTNVPDFATMLTVSSSSVAVRTGTPPGTWTEMFDVGAAGPDNLGMQLNRLTALTASTAALNDTETLNAAPLGWICMQALYKAPASAFPHIVVVDSAVAQSTSR